LYLLFCGTLFDLFGPPQHLFTKSNSVLILTYINLSVTSEAAVCQLLAKRSFVWDFVWDHEIQ